MIITVDPTKCDDSVLKALLQQESFVAMDFARSIMDKTGQTQMTMKLNTHTNSTKIISIDGSNMTTTKEISYGNNDNIITALYEYNIDVPNIAVVPHNTRNREYVTLQEMQKLTNLMGIDVIINLQPSYHGLFKSEEKMFIVHNTLKIVGLQIVRNDMMKDMKNGANLCVKKRNSFAPISRKMKIVNNIASILERQRREGEL